jgi:hypothetical protein
LAGKALPETVKPAPLIVAEFTVTGAVPVDVRVTLCVVRLPGETGPRAPELEAIDSFGTGRVVPIPLSVTIETRLPDEVLFTASCPVAAPLVAGLNRTSSVSC